MSLLEKIKVLSGGRRFDLLCHMAQSSTGMTAAEAAEFLEVTRIGACQYLRALEKAGFLRSEREGKKRRYFYYYNGSSAFLRELTCVIG